MKKKILALTLALCASLSAAAIPVSAEVETKSAAIANIDMSWPYIKADNKAATKAINSDLRVYMDDFRYDYMYRKFLSGPGLKRPMKIKILPVLCSMICAMMGRPIRQRSMPSTTI